MRNLYDFENNKLIFFDRVCLLHEHLLTSLPIAFLCASIIFINTISYINPPLVLAWYCTALAIFLLRLGFYLGFKRSPYRSHLHLTLYTIGTTLTACLWAAAGTILMPKEVLPQTLIIVVIAGVTAGGIQTIQASRLASVLYILISLLPLTCWLFLAGTQTYYLVSASVFLYLIFMLATSKRGYDLIISAFKLQYENSAINGQLAQSNKLLNEQLLKHKQNEKSLALLAEIVRHSKDAIIGLDLTGHIQTWNKGAESLYGFSQEEILGKTTALITYQTEKDLLQSMFEKVKNNASFQNIELQRIHKNGRIIPVSITLSPIKNSEGQVIGFSSMDRDISERKEVDKVKNEFISVVSHELRTPITSIKGSIDLLLHKEVSANKAVHLLKIALTNCNRLIRLINDILDVEKIESGKMHFNFRNLNLAELLHNAIKETESYAHDHEVKIRLLAGGSAIVHADYDKLMQVMINLLSNAVKFSHPHSYIDVKMIKQRQVVRVCVTDYGPGIPVEFQGKIFCKFTQSDSSSSRTKGGTGLGLNISKAILEEHGSKINFFTEINKGTTFYFDLVLINENVNANSKFFIDQRD